GRIAPDLIPPPRITGMITLDALITGNFAIFLDALKHLFLPAISLAMGPLAQEARITRSSINDNLKKDYIAAERSCGIPVIRGGGIKSGAILPIGGKIS
ncbi:unnamed protein product, partial [marine sediment metagenome]